MNLINDIFLTSNKIYSLNPLKDIEINKFMRYRYSKEKELYELEVNDILISEFYLKLTHLYISECENEDVSDVLFLIYVLINCLDIDFSKRPSSKTKLILLMNLINSKANNKSNLLKKILFFHPTNNEVIEHSGLFIENNKILYLNNNLKNNIIDIYSKVFQDSLINNLKIAEKTIDTIYNITTYLFKLIIDSSSDLTKINDNCNINFLLDSIVRNTLAVSDLYDNNLNLFIETFIYTLGNYTLASWESECKNVSLYYGIKNNSKIDSLINYDENFLQFNCEYFIETSIIDIFNSSPQKINSVMNFLDDKDSFLFKIILFKSNLITNEIRLDLRKDIIRIFN